MDRPDATVKPTVKPKRAYDSSRRREEASRTRERIIGTAERLFLRDGYAATTIASIAAAVDVSPDTIYKAFGGKPGLVRAIRSQGLLGAGPVPAEQRSDHAQTTESDARRIIETWGKLTTEVAPRVAPILLLVRSAAATDPEMQALLGEMDTDRMRRMTGNARRLRATGQVRAGISLSHTADILFTYSAPELYELLVLRRGWPPKRYGQFVAEAMIDALL